MNKAQTFIFIGRSGCGKGTQISLLSKYISNLDPKTGSYFFVIGDVLRSFVKGEGYAQNSIKNTINSGGLIPDLITNSLFVSHLLNNFKVEEHLYIDGIPRSSTQAHALIEIIKFYNRQDTTVVINIEVNKENVEKRMFLRGRPDDTKEAIQKRLKYYEENVVPAINVLEKESGFNYIEIDGNNTIEEIHKEIIAKLNI